MALGNGLPPAPVNTSVPPNVSAQAAPTPNTANGGGWSVDPGSMNDMGGIIGATQNLAGQLANGGGGGGAQPSNLSNILATLKAYYGPQFNALNQAGQSQLNDLNARAGYYGQQGGFLNDDYNQGLQRLGIQRSINGIDQNYYRGNIDLENQLMANHQAMFGNITQNQQSVLGNIQQNLANQLATIGLKNTQDVQQAHSQGVAGGFGMAPGQQIGINQINQGANLQRTGANIDAARATQAANYQAAQERYTQQNRVLQEQMSKNGMQRQYDILQQQAKGFGIDEASLMTTLQKGLAGLNLDKQLNTSQILNLAADKDPQRAALGKQFISDLMNYGNAYGVDSNEINNYISNFGPGSF